MKIKEKIYNYVEEKENVTFAELAYYVPGFEGDKQMVIAEYNIIIWSGMSDGAYEAITQLNKEKRIHLSPCNSLTYLIDGAQLNIPIAKRKHKYKKPRWAPTQINTMDGARRQGLI